MASGRAKPSSRFDPTEKGIVTQEQTDWHRRFGLMVKDFFTGTPCEVELERDLSVKSQFLDVLVLHKTAAILDRVLPDGLEGYLVEHNLITFKSHRDIMHGWAIDELHSHYVSYRKQISPSFDDLVPQDRFRLFAISARFPQSLHARKPLTEVQEGVYEIEWGLTPIRIIVAGRLPATKPNSLLHLFSASESLVEYGKQHCRIWSPQTGTLVLDLFAGYQVEGLTVPYTMEDFILEAERRAVLRAPVEMRLEGIPTEMRLEGIPTEQLLEKLIQEGKTHALTPEAREKLRLFLEEPPTSHS